MAQVKSKTGRRNFLLAVGAGGAATIAAVAAKTQISPLPATTGTGKRATKGYTASAHVNNYYRTTKV